MIYFVLIAGALTIFFFLQTNKKGNARKDYRKKRLSRARQEYYNAIMPKETITDKDQNAETAKN